MNRSRRSRSNSGDSESRAPRRVPRRGPRSAHDESEFDMAENGAVLYKPLGLLAELTHRCPLGCPYCSNPLALDPRGSELDTQTWARVFAEAAALGVLQVHLSGGEPGARRDLVAISCRCAPVRRGFIASGICCSR